MHDWVIIMQVLLVLLIVSIIVFGVIFVIIRQSPGMFDLNEPLPKQHQSNYDNNVIYPLRRLKGNLTVIDYRDNYDLITSEFSIGYAQGFMAYSTFEDIMELGNHKRVIDRIAPFTKTIIARVFSDKERADLLEFLDSDLTTSESWIDGYESGCRDCETWQQTGEFSNTWIYFIRNDN